MNIYKKIRTMPTISCYLCSLTFPQMDISNQHHSSRVCFLNVLHSCLGQFFVNGSADQYCVDLLLELSWWACIWMEEDLVYTLSKTDLLYLLNWIYGIFHTCKKIVSNLMTCKSVFCLFYIKSQQILGKIVHWRALLFPVQGKLPRIIDFYFY